jgi:hypothetical protein
MLIDVAPCGAVVAIGHRTAGDLECTATPPNESPSRAYGTVAGSVIFSGVVG